MVAGFKLTGRRSEAKFLGVECIRSIDVVSAVEATEVVLNWTLS